MNVYKKSLALILIMTIIASLTQISTALAEPTVTDKSLEMLSNVVGFDLSKYNVTLLGHSINYASSFGPDVKQEIVDYALESSGTKTLVNLVFEDGHLWYFTLNTIGNKPLYTQAPSTNVIDQGKNLIQKYQTYAAQNYEADTSYVKPMASMLNSVSELKTTTITSGNMRLNISITPMSNVENIKLQWMYIENGLEIPRKAVSILFKDGTLYSFHDSWNLLTIGGHSEISQEEALSMAWTTAQKYTLKFGSENGSVIEVKPDLSNVTAKVLFSMTTRNSTALYPLWQVYYYFNKNYYGAYGIQIGIWGDTKEVFYCKSLSNLGDYGTGSSATSDPNNPSTFSPGVTSGSSGNSLADSGTQNTGPQANNQSMENDNNSSFNIYLIAIVVIGIAVSVAAIGIGIKKRRSK
jgi:hypothetical protein